MSYISGVRCGYCGTMVVFAGKWDKSTLFKKMKREGWVIIRKHGPTPEQTYCCADHAEKGRRLFESKRGG